MGSKTIHLDEDAYEKLAAHRRDGESYSETVERLLGGPSLLELQGIYSEEEVETVEAKLHNSDVADRRRRRMELERRG